VSEISQERRHLGVRRRGRSGPSIAVAGHRECREFEVLNFHGEGEKFPRRVPPGATGSVGTGLRKHGIRCLPRGQQLHPESHDSQYCPDDDVGAEMTGAGARRPPPTANRVRIDYHGVRFCGNLIGRGPAGDESSRGDLIVVVALGGTETERAICSADRRRRALPSRRSAGIGWLYSSGARSGGMIAMAPRRRRRSSRRFVRSKGYLPARQADRRRSARGPRRNADGGTGMTVVAARERHSIRSDEIFIATPPARGRRRRPEWHDRSGRRSQTEPSENAAQAPG
jgi:hypothetical protein